MAGKLYQLCVRIVRNRAYKNGYDLFEANDLSLVSYKMNSKIYYALSISGQNQWFNDEICHTARQSIVMEPRHGCKLEDLCRICGCKLFIDRKQAKVKKSYPCTYQCSSYTEEILQAFHIDTKKDSPEIHPQKLCNKCYLSMKRVTAAAQKKTPYKCSVEPYDWFIHSVERCKVLCP